MKVAILGGGVAGLSCAHELERYGIRPVVYERNSFTGDQISHVSALLEVVDRPIKNILEYMRSEYSIELRPLNLVHKLTHISPNKRTVIRGRRLGYSFARGRDKHSVVNQLFSQLNNTEIRFNEAPDIDRLSSQNDYVVLANGSSLYTEMLGCWQNMTTTYVRGAILYGDFDKNELFIWFNKDYSKRGYAYLTPFSEKKASVVLVVTDVDENEVDYYWELFLTEECIKYKITEEFKLEHKSGYVYPLTVDNFIFTGNSAGAIDPFLGFGQFNSITTGVMAARSIVLGKDYEKLVWRFRENIIQMQEFRKFYDSLDNKGYDRIITAIGLPGIKQIAYHSPFDVIKIGTALMKLIPAKPR